MLGPFPLLIGPLREEELREVNRSACTTPGGELEPGLLELLLADMKGQAGALPFLEHALFKLWEQREGRRLTAKAYLDMAGLEAHWMPTPRSSSPKRSPAKNSFCAGSCSLVDLVHPGEGAADAKKRVSVDDVAISESSTSRVAKAGRRAPGDAADREAQARSGAGRTGA